MSRYKTVYTEVEVDVYIGDFDTDDLIEELESRGTVVGIGTKDPTVNQSLLEAIYHKRRTNRDYQSELDSLIYNTLGKIL